MPWTTEIPQEPGFYLWRINFDNADPPTVEPFVVYDLFGTLRVQELSLLRDKGSYGSWSWSEWAYRVNEPDERPTEYLWLGPLTTSIALVRAFRELYHAAVSAHRDLMWTPDLSEHGKAVASELAAAINEIHKETN